MTTLAQLKAQALQNVDVSKEYEALDAEFQLIDRLLKMRTKAGLTQEQALRKKMSRNVWEQKRPIYRD